MFGISRGQCINNQSNTSVCDTQTTLSIGVNANSNYTWDWYECDAMGNNNQFIGNGTSQIVFAQTPYVNQTHYYIYICSDPSNNGILICTSPIFVVEFQYTPVLSYTLPLTGFELEAGSYSNINSYISYQWYLGGNPITGATNSTYTPTLAGTYMVACSSATCGLQTTSVYIGSTCHASLSDVQVCSDSPTLNSVFAPGIDYYWYVSEGTLTNSNTVTYSGYSYYKSGCSISLYKSDFTSNCGTYRVYYEGKYNNITICSSPVFTVSINNTPPEIQSNSTTLPANLSHNLYSGSAQYLNYNYQWYRNGVLLPNDTMDNMVARLPGSYTFTCEAPECNTQYSQSYIFSCQPQGVTVFENDTAPQGDHIYSGDIYISGTYRIEAGSTITFKHARISVEHCGEIIVLGNKTQLPLLGGKLILDSSYICGCDDTWQGIKLYGGDTSVYVDTVYPKSGQVWMNNSQLYDAVIGLHCIEYPHLYVKQSIFENNVNHISMNTCWNMNGYVTHSKFSYLSKLPNPICYTSPPNYIGNTPVYDVYAEYISNFRFELDTFIGQALNGLQTDNGIIVIGVHFPPKKNNPFVFEVKNCNFWGNMNYGIMIKEANKVGILNQSNYRFYGQINRPINLHNGTTCRIEGVQIENDGTGYTESGIKVKNCSSTDIINNSVIRYNRGIEMYGVGDVNVPYMTRAFDNSVSECTYGIAVAHEEFPVSTTATSNDITLVKGLQITCNRILDCQYGIVGSGAMIDQGDLYLDWGNRFCSNVSSNQCQNNSSSTGADVVWWSNDSNLLVNFYLDKNNKPSSQHPNSSYNRNLKKLSALDTVYIDGYPITVGGLYKNELQFSEKIVYGLGIDSVIQYACPSNQYNFPFREFVVEQDKNIPFQLYPNPATDHIIINGVLVGSNIEIYSSTGQLVKQIYIHENTMEIPIYYLPSGIYILKGLQDNQQFFCSKLVRL